VPTKTGSDKKKGKEVYLLRKEVGGYKVIKLVDDPEHGPTIGSEYSLTREAMGYRCNCPGYSHRRDCKHITMPAAEVEDKEVTLEDARAIVRELLHDLRSVFREVALTDEPYARGPSGKIVRIDMILRGPVVDNCILSKGTWEGHLSGSGIKTRLIVD
jgi:hypothetical protein